MARVKVISREITTIEYTVTVKQLKDGVKVYNEYQYATYDIGLTDKAIKANIEKAFEVLGTVVDIEKGNEYSAIYECSVAEFMKIAKLSKRQVIDKDADTDADSDADNG